MARMKIAVSDDLAPLKQLLQEEGYQVTSAEKGIQGCACVVTSGMQDNQMGVEETQTEAPIISAQGRDAQEILAEIKERVRIQ